MEKINRVWLDGLFCVAQAFLKQKTSLEEIAFPVWEDTIKKMISEENNIPDQSEKILKAWQNKPSEEKKRDFANSDRSFEEFIKQIKSHPLLAKLSTSCLN